MYDVFNFLLILVIYISYAHTIKLTKSSRLINSFTSIIFTLCSFEIQQLFTVTIKESAVKQNIKIQKQIIYSTVVSIILLTSIGSVLIGFCPYTSSRNNNMTNWNWLFSDVFWITHERTGINEYPKNVGSALINSDIGRYTFGENVVTRTILFRWTKERSCFIKCTTKRKTKF